MQKSFPKADQFGEIKICIAPHVHISSLAPLLYIGPVCPPSPFFFSDRNATVSLPVRAGCRKIATSDEAMFGGRCERTVCPNESGPARACPGAQFADTTDARRCMYGIQLPLPETRSRHCADYCRRPVGPYRLG